MHSSARRIAALSLLIAAVCAVYLSAQDRRLERPASNTEHRVALVVGNDAYSGSPLRNAVADARAIARVLEDDLGFSVSLVVDARLETLETRIDAFVRQVQPGDVALFFYSGHGVEIGGENYLLPVDFVTPEQEVQVKRRSVAASEVLERLGERGARIRLLVLDACRDNPYRGKRSGANGLTPLEARGALVAFAAAPGQTASDNPGKTNGLFTTELLSALREPGLGVPEIFRRVRQRVNDASGGRQFPWLSDGLVGDFVLRPGVRRVEAPVDTGVSSANREDQLWASIKDMKTPEVFEDYLARVSRQELPGLYSAAAKARLQELRAALERERPSRETSTATGITKSAFDGTVWRSVCRSCFPSVMHVHLRSDGEFRFSANDPPPDSLAFRPCIKKCIWRLEGSQLVISWNDATSVERYDFPNGMSAEVTGTMSNTAGTMELERVR